MKEERGEVVLLPISVRSPCVRCTSSYALYTHVGVRRENAGRGAFCAGRRSGDEGNCACGAQCTMALLSNKTASISFVSPLSFCAQVFPSKLATALRYREPRRNYVEIS